MPEHLSPELETRLKSLSEQISVDRSLDEAIQKELLGHMEDKALALLNNEEPLTEDDVFLLVREHFGDPSIIKGMMHSTYPINASAHFIRRLAAIVCASIPLLLVTHHLTSFILEQIGRNPQMLARFSDPSAALSFTLWLSFLPPLLSLPQVYLLWLVLRYWQHRIKSGRSVWFFEWPLAAVITVCVMVFTAGWVFSAGHAGVPGGSLQYLFRGGSFYISSLIIFETFAAALLWIWWCDTPPRLSRSIVAAVCAWGTFESLLVSRIFTNLLGLDPHSMLGQILQSGHFLRAAPFRRETTQYILSNVELVAVAGMLSALLYWFVKRKIAVRA